MKQNIVLKYFSEICKIPHVSGQEQALIEYIVKILKKNKCKVEVDKLGNIYAFKDGKLKVPGICFQAHLDMVGEKTLESRHDFKIDPIDFYEEHGWIKARGTTLGADNGVGVALILSLLTDPTVKHGPIEAIFTVQEETTTIGAVKLSNNWIKSPYLINLDSESSKVITIGTGWCCDFNGSLPIKRKQRTEDTTDLSVRIINGVGGHSGSSIHLSTVNTIVEIFNILKTVTQKYQFNIVDVKSTTQLNAIPPHCDVVINIKRNQVNHFRKMMLTQFNYLLEAHQQNDKNISLVIDNVRAIADPLITQDTNKLINLVCAANNGLNAYNITYNVPNVSTNLGKLTLTTNEAQFAWLQRSNDQYDLNKLNNKLICLFELINGKYKITNQTEGVTTNVNNRLALQLQRIAQTTFNYPMQLQPTHTVLEIGDIIKHYPTITAVSIGCNIKNPHTPREAVEISSIFYIYNLIKELLQLIK